MTCFFRQLLSLKRAYLRTRAKLRLFVIQLTILVLQTLRFWHVQPTAKHAFPRCKPAQFLASWIAHFPRPRHFWRAVIQVLMRAYVVVVKAKLLHRLFKSIFAVDLNVANRAFKCAEKALDSAILPRAVRVASLMANAKFFHAGFEFIRHKCAVIVGTNGFRFTKRLAQIFNQGQCGAGAFISERQRQIFPAAMIDHADQQIGQAANSDVGKIQRPSLIWPLWFRWLAKLFAQAHPFIARFLFQLRDIRFAHRFATAGEFGVKSVGNCAHTGFFHQRQKAKNFGFDPAWFSVVFGVGLALFGGMSTAQAGVLAGLGNPASQGSIQQQEQNRQQNQKVEGAAESDWHVVSLDLESALAWQGLAVARQRSANQGSKDGKFWLWARVGTLRSPAGNGNETSFTYNALNQKLTASYPELRGTSMTPTAWGELLDETDARGNTTTYTVDAAGWRTRITRPGLPLSVTQLSYDPNGNVLSETDPRGFVTTHLYDALNRKIRTTYPAPSAVANAVSAALVGAKSTAVHPEPVEGQTQHITLHPTSPRRTPGPMSESELSTPGASNSKVAL